MYMKQWRQ